MSGYELMWKRAYSHERWQNMTAAQREARRVYMRQWRANHRDHVRTNAKRMATTYHRRWKLKKMGLTQIPIGPHLCPICKKREGVVMDHDHETGKFRGMLCVGCNAHLGTAEKHLANIITYLRK